MPSPSGRHAARGATRGGRRFLAATTPSIPYAVFFLSDSPWRKRIHPESLESGKIEAMTAETNLGSTRRMVRALRQSERLTESNIALSTLALSTARALDEALTSGERRYVVDRLSRAHLAALQALERIPGPDGPDPFSELLAAA